MLVIDDLFSTTANMCLRSFERCFFEKKRFLCVTPLLIN